MAWRYSTGCFNSFLSTLRTDLNDGCIKFYSGSQPASPDDAPTGTLIATCTVGGATWNSSTGANGIAFDAPSGATMDKAAAETWQFVCSTAGTIGYGRFVAIAEDGTSSTTKKRIDFSVGVTSGDVRMSKVTYAVGETGTASAFSVPLSNIS